MRFRPHQPRYRSIGVVAIVLVLGWIFLAPPLLGGRTSYVIVNGNSMHPTYERGDLVLVRRQSNYQVGDIVTYRHPEIGAVIHRIVDVDGARFVIQGDNNSWLDSYRPLPSEVIGNEWVRLPKVGKAITWARGPGLVIFIIAVIGVGVVLPPSDQRRVGQRVSRAPRGGSRAARNDNDHDPRERGRPSRQPRSRQPGPPCLDQRAKDTLGWVGLIAVACLIAGGFAFTRPVERDVTVDATYDQSGQFSYEAAAPSGIYDTDVVETGDPIFRQVSNSVSVAFAYQLESQLPAIVSGSWDLNAVLSSDNGWSRTVPLITGQRFDGTAFSAAATIDLATLRAITGRVAEQTGVTLDRFLLRIVPQVTIDGTLGGETFSDVFAPGLTFSADPMELTLVSGSEGNDPLAPVKTGIVRLPKREPNTIPVLSWAVTVMFTRVVAAGGLLLSAIIAATFVGMSMRASRIAAGARAPSQYSGLLVDISDPDPAMTAQSQVVAVRSFDDLARLAECDNQVILRHAANGLERFIVRCAGITYQYSVNLEPAQ